MLVIRVLEFLFDLFVCLFLGKGTCQVFEDFLSNQAKRPSSEGRKSKSGTQFGPLLFITYFVANMFRGNEI